MGGNRPHDTSEQASAKAASGGRSDPDRRRVAGVPRRRERRRPIRQLPRPGNSDQDRAHRVGVFDRSNQTQAPTAARACQHVDVERAPHQIGPRPVTRDRRRRRLVTRLGDDVARGHRRLNWRRTTADHACSPGGVGREHAVVEHQVDPRSRGKRGQLYVGPRMNPSPPPLAVAQR